MSMKPVGWLGQEASRHDHCYPSHKTIQASSDVLAEGFRMVCVGDAVAAHGGTCSKHPAPHGAKVQKGSASVFVNGKSMARQGDPVKCDTGQMAPLLRGRTTVSAGELSPFARARARMSAEVATGAAPDIAGGQGGDLVSGEGNDRLGPSSMTGVRAYRVGADGVIRPVDLGAEPRYPARPGHILRPVSPEDLNRALAENQPRSTRNASVEDGSTRVRIMIMGYEESLSGRYISAMTKLGELLDFRVEARVNSHDLTSLTSELAGAKNLTVVEVKSKSNTWTEDAGETVGPDEVRVPTLIEDKSFIKKVIDDARASRLLSEGIDPNAPFLPYALGVVNSTNAGAAAAEQALRTGMVPVRTRGYAEGGNTLMGTMADGRPFAVVGYSSAVVTQKNMERTEGRVDGRERMLKEARFVIANDLGVAPKDVIFVEQPEFHIDMRMMMLPGGKGVVVNDSLEAARVQAGWLRNQSESQRPSDGASQQDIDAWTRAHADIEARIQNLANKAKTRSQLEDVAARQLQEKGIAVYRVAGNFDDLRSPLKGKEAMNFLNSERGIAPDGSQYYIGLAGTPEAEKYFMDQMKSVPSGVSTFYFVGTPQDTGNTLSLGGGISCRVKSSD